jgi:tRNA nucleotidyltransferase/poly(A) polymerase
MLSRLGAHPVISAFCETARSGKPLKAFLVGGILRDILISGTIGRDFDFVIEGNKGRVRRIAESLAEKLGGSPFVLDKERGSYRVALPDGLTADLAVLEGKNITDDLLKRDFTVNAMAVDMGLVCGGAAGDTDMIDPTGAVVDARGKVLRMVYPEAFDDDPLRALRAVRVAFQCGLTMTEDAASAVKESAGLLKRVSIERVRDELLHMFRNLATAGAIEALYDLKLIEAVLPRTGGWRDVSGYDLLGHALKAVREAERFIAKPGRKFARLKPTLGKKVCGLDAGVALKLAAFLHDAGKPATIEREGAGLSFTGHDREGAEIVRKALTRLKFSRKAGALLKTLVERHHRVFELAGLKDATRRAKSRFFTSAGAEAGLMLLALAVIDARATRGGPDKDLERFAAGMVDFYFDDYVVREPKRLMGGKEVMAAFGVEEGLMVGEIMAIIAEGEEEGLVKDRAGAVEYVKRRLGK